MTTHMKPHPKPDRMTIGYVADNIDGAVGEAIWKGIMGAAQQAGVNVICVAGGRLHQDEIFREYETILYELINNERMDGLIFWSSSICASATEEETLQFHQRYDPLPIVTLTRPVARYPVVTTDNTPGMRAMLEHLIRDHGYRRIAFVRGPENRAPSQERYQLYCDVLSAYHIPLDPTLITPPKPFFPKTGIEAGQTFLDERHLQPGTDVDAIVCVSDNVAIPLIAMLQERGVQIPSDLAVVGVNDLPEGRCLTPPLTTVAIPLYDQGYRAFTILLNILRGKSVPPVTTLPSSVIFRQSCGCPNPSVIQASKSFTSRRAFSPETYQHLLEELRPVIAFPARIATDTQDSLLAAFASDMYAETDGAFLQTLEGVLWQSLLDGKPIFEWQKTMSELREILFSWDIRKILRERAERLVRIAHVLIGETAHRAQVSQLMQERKREIALRHLSQTLITTFEIQELMDILTTQLPTLGIPSCFLAVYENPQPYRYPQPAPEWARLILAYVNGVRTPLGEEGRRVATQQFPPDDLWPAERRVTMILQALHFRDEQIGVVMFEPGPRDGLLYYHLSREISSALQGALLVRQIKAHQAELARERDLLHTLMKSSPDYLFFKDRESRFIRTNTAHAQQLLGLKGPEDAVGKTDFDLFPGQEAQRFFEEEQRIMETGQPVVAREWSLHSSTTGKIVWLSEHKVPIIDAAGHVVGLMCISRDVTAQKQAEAALVREKYIVDTFLENIPDSIYFKDRESRIIRSNKAHAASFGLTDPGDLVGKSDFDLFPEEQAQPKYAQEREILRTGEPILAREETDAGGRWALTTKMPLRDEHGVIIGTFGISRDITQLKATEAALQEAKNTAEEAQRRAEDAQRASESANRAKSEFLANMSHELRTPLNGILGYAQILKRDPVLLPRQQEALDIIQQSGQHLLTLITDILDLAKIEAGKLALSLTYFNFPRFLDGILGLIRLQAQNKGLEFRHDFPPQLPSEVYADERRLRQVLLNLLWNAVKFTDRGSVTLRIVDLGCTISDGEDSSPASINQKSNIRNLQFEISDTGVGMTPEHVTVIFRSFEQVGNHLSRMGGAGLGLAISRQLVRLMGGEIQVRSVFGQGSTFWFDLSVSVVQADPHAIPASERVISGYRGPQQQALIVDNDLINRRVLTDLLHAVGFECVEAEHGLEALEKARARRPDVILLDWFMPIMNGFDTVRQLRQDPALADVVVFAVSASAFDSDQARSLSAGCQAFLSKPVDDRRLFQELETHLKLEWLYQERGAGNTARALRTELSCVAPPHDELKRLHELVLQGNLFGIQERAAALARGDATFHPFAAQLIRLAKTYQDEQLLAFLGRCLKEEEYE